ncbi:MAG: hypothetical protein C5B54_11680, partial [Acidobacteria bacterium]
MLKISTNNDISEIILNHPPGNILNFDLIDALLNAVDEVSNSRILILASALPHFSYGVDVKIHTPELVPQMLSKFHHLIRKLYHFSGLTICCV